MTTGAAATPPAGAARPAAKRVTEAPSSSGFSYHTVSEVKQGSSIVVTVTVEESLKFSKLILAYREQGTSEFLGREMEPVGERRVPRRDPGARATGGYVGRRTTWRRRTTRASRSARAAPRRARSVISFAATAKPSKGRADAAVETEGPRRRPREDDEEGNRGKIFVGLQVGSGFGYTSGTAR